MACNKSYVRDYYIQYSIKLIAIFLGVFFALITTFTAKAQTSQPTNKVWFITGANRGIGEAIAKAALEHGDKVVATARSQESAAKALGNSKNLLILKLDVTKEDQIQQAVKDAVAKFGRIDVLVNNAGYGQLGFFEETRNDAIKKEFDVNVFGTMNVTRAVLPYLRSQKSGFIVSLSSIGGVVSSKGCSIYCSSKFAIEGWMEGLSHEVNPLGIHTLIVEPGGFRTDFLDNSSVKYGSTKIADYKASAQTYRDNYDSANHKQIGDPVKLGKAVVTLVYSANPPLRFLAGTDAIDRAEQMIQNRQKELNTWRSLSTSLGFNK